MNRFYFFCITAVGLPVLGIAAVVKNHSLERLTLRVDPVFALVFTTLIYITIGPAFGIPRAANMPFEIGVMPLIGPENENIARFFYTFIYFIVNYIICVKPNGILDILGKFLTPFLLLMIAVIFIVVFFNPLGEMAEPINSYKNGHIASGFINGYQTLDALGSLVFAMIVIKSIKNLGLHNPKTIAKTTIRCGILAGAILALIYIALAYIGATTSSVFATSKNGTEILSFVAIRYFGEFEQIFLGVIFLLACLTTTVGLISSVSEFFALKLPKINYQKQVAIWSFLGFLVANVGLNTLLKYSIPVLYALYPITIILIILGLMDSFIGSSKIIYRSCIYVVVFLGFFKGLSVANINVLYISNALLSLPLYEKNLGWILPELIAFALSYIVFILRRKNI